MTTEAGPGLPLSALASRAGVSVRTIRYYMQVGLVEAPPFRGRETTYPESYIDRLKAIRRLRDRGLHLGRIAELLETLTDEQRGLVAQGVLSLDASGRFIVEAGTGGPATGQAPRMVDPFSSARPDERALADLDPSPAADGRRAATRRPDPGPTTWRRIAVAPGVELQVDLEALVSSGRARGQAGALRLASQLEAVLRGALRHDGPADDA